MRTTFNTAFIVAPAIAAIAFGLGIVVGCPQSADEDPCAACTVTAQRNACVAVLRDECDQFPEGSPAHEACHGRAAAKCTGGEGEGEGAGEGEGEGAAQ